MSAGDWYRWWGGAIGAVGGRVTALRIPHPARLLEVERERVAKREAMFAVMWTVLLSGPFFASAMGGAVPVLAQVAQLSDRWFALALAMPSLAMLVQLPGALVVSRVKNRPKTVFVVGMMARLVWVPAAAVPLVLDPGPVATGVLMGFLVVAWLCFFMGALAWQSYMGDLVPARKRGKYFGLRLRLFSATNLVSSLALAMVLPVAGSPWAKWVIFAIFCVAAVAGAAELFAYRKAYDPPRRKPAMRWRDLLTPVLDRGFWPFLVLVFIVSASNGIVGPFLWRHFLQAQQMPPFKATLILQTSALLGMLLTAPVWGAWVDRFGSKATLVFAMLISQIPTMLWPVVSLELWWLGVGVMFAGVAAWTGVEVSLTNRLFRHGHEGGAGYFAVYSATFALAGFGSTVLGGEIAERWAGAAWISSVADWGRPWGLSFNVYLVLSFVCLALRFLAVAWLMRFIPRDKPTPTAVAVRTMADQMQAGAVGAMAWPWRKLRRDSPRRH